MRLEIERMSELFGKREETRKFSLGENHFPPLNFS